MDAVAIFIDINKLIIDSNKIMHLFISINKDKMGKRLATQVTIERFLPV